LDGGGAEGKRHSSHHHHVSYIVDFLFGLKGKMNSNVVLVVEREVGEEAVADLSRGSVWL
jgi:hypothetical protein